MSKPKQTIVPSETIYVAILIHVTLYTCYVYTVLLLHLTLPEFIKPQVVNVFTRKLYSPLFKAGDVRELDSRIDLDLIKKNSCWQTQIYQDKKYRTSFAT